METTYRLPPLTKPPYLMTSYNKKLKTRQPFDFVNKTNIPASFSLSHATIFEINVELCQPLLCWTRLHSSVQNSSIITSACFHHRLFPGKQVFTQIPTELCKILVFVLIPHEKLKQGSRLVFIHSSIPKFTIVFPNLWLCLFFIKTWIHFWIHKNQKWKFPWLWMSHPFMPLTEI